LLAIRLMRMGAKKRPAYRVVVKERLSKRDGAYIENVGTYNPTRDPAEVSLDMERVRYWIERGAQPSPTVERLIKGQARAAAAEAQQAEAAA
jgi:small subunit ribosomal protein S16